MEQTEEGCAAVSEIVAQDTRAGAAISFRAAAIGDTIRAGVTIGGWSRPRILIARNGNALTSRTVTVSGHDALAVPASTTAALAVGRAPLLHLKPLTVSYDSTADVQVAVLAR